MDEIINGMNVTHFYPEYLTQRRCWVLWRLEEVRKDGKSRQTKVPYNAMTGAHASSTNADTWADYNTAARAYEAHSGEYQGLGCVMSKSLGLVFIDIDHCLTDGKPDERAKDILSALPNTYTELSQSGTGIHIFVQGTVPRCFKNSSLNVEMYDHARFCAMTGKALQPVPPVPNAAGLNYVFEKYRTPERQQRQPERQQTATLEDAKIIELARQHGDKFALLYDSGNYTAAGYSSQSEADIALCLMLAYWTDRDPAAIDRIFRTSALYRDKWNRTDYRENTIQAACSQCEESFSEWKRRTTAETFSTAAPEDKTSFQKDILEAVKKLDPMHNKRFSVTDDITAGRLFAAVFKGKALYNTTQRNWMTYNGRVWEQDEGNVQAEKLAQELTRCLQAYVLLNFPESPTDAEKAFKRFAFSLGGRQQRLKMLEDAKAYIYTSSEALDANGDMLNCLNGVLNLRTGEFTEHKPEYLLSKCSGVNYDPAAHSELWDSFTRQVTAAADGTENGEKLEYLQRLCGYSLTAENAQEECYLIYGSTTRNGKSTFLETVGAAMGDYAMNIDPDTLAQKDRNTRNASGDIARLKGCRFLRCSEPPKRMIFDCARLKTLLGRDTITARHLYEREIEFIPIFKLFINSNYLPVITDDTVFSSGRIKVISFDRHFTEAEQDTELKSKLRTPDTLSAVLNWMLDGLKTYRRQGTQPPECVKAATAEYRQSSDKIGSFISECLESDPKENVSANAAYTVFAEWCKANGYGTDSKKSFLEELRNKSLLSGTGTVDGRTLHNVIKGYHLCANEPEENPFLFTNERKIQ